MVIEKQDYFADIGRSQTELIALYKSLKHGRSLEFFTNIHRMAMSGSRRQQEVLVAPIFPPSGGPPDRVRACAAAE
ncbi:hypothetical protein N2601_31740 (plasmid) [Rhizobium sp. CB3060]|uniref:hypothetical protein n=1 Tax=Rhizobium sp. CB3060 TaxID=3138255 RepID=UPI0021A472E7|nr:hypothetical protein [Rhizobium tropici]UWU25857.1 hypothetical protein N2601_31740 [Rhizobium tropici]